MRNLANAPSHLQIMLLELQKYDVTIKYRPGKKEERAEAQSREKEQWDKAKRYSQLQGYMHRQHIQPVISKARQ